MSVIDQLASSLGRRDEVPNQELAAAIAKKNDKKAVQELVANLNKKKDIQNDCIKTLYEIGAIKPALIADHVEEFAALLDNKNNRLQWGAMTALSAVVLEKPKAIFAMLPQILDAAEAGTVITRDRAVIILAGLASLKEYNDQVFPFLIEQILKAPVNQAAMYAEKALPAVTEKTRASFLKALNSRLEDIEQESKRTRIEKVIKKARHI